MTYITEHDRDNIYQRFPGEYSAKEAARRMGQWLCVDRRNWWYVVGYYRLREAIADGLVGVPWK